MKKQLQSRLESLKAELESGQQVLAELEAKQASVRDTLLRISGAIQVIEEELQKAEESEDAQVFGSNEAAGKNLSESLTPSS